jgi:catechol 2,3-dioxygenase-like lactoylglutathione lyase family enzyme
MAAMWSKVPLVTLVPIRNMNRAIKFYTKTLGGKLGDRGLGEMRDAWASVTVGKNQIWLVGGPRPEKRKLAYSLFSVKNVRAVVKKLKQQGVKFERAERMGEQTKIEGEIAWEPFGGSAFFKDSEGNLFMVWQIIPPM